MKECAHWLSFKHVLLGGKKRKTQGTSSSSENIIMLLNSCAA